MLGVFFHVDTGAPNWNKNSTDLNCTHTHTQSWNADYLWKQQPITCDLSVTTTGRDQNSLITEMKATRDWSWSAPLRLWLWRLHKEKVSSNHGEHNDPEWSLGLSVFQMTAGELCIARGPPVSPRRSLHINYGSCRIIRKAVTYSLHHMSSKITCAWLLMTERSVITQRKVKWLKGEIPPSSRHLLNLTIIHERQIYSLSPALSFSATGVTTPSSWVHCELGKEETDISLSLSLRSTAVEYICVGLGFWCARCSLGEKEKNAAAAQHLLHTKDSVGGCHVACTVRERYKS